MKRTQLKSGASFRIPFRGTKSRLQEDEEDDTFWTGRFLPFVVHHLSEIFLFVAGLVLGLWFHSSPTVEKVPEPVELPEVKVIETGPDLLNPVRPAPEQFKRDTTMPKNVSEGDASGSITTGGFSAGRDLVYLDDPRVWWESDHDGETDDECDHTFHVALEIPFRRLVNLVTAAGWQLRVQECYRPSGTHADRSLHKEGRAIDITVDRLEGERLTPFEKIAAYEELSKLAWQAGFDWVYYEYKKGTGPHVHVSGRADGPRMPSGIHTHKE